VGDAFLSRTLHIVRKELDKSRSEHKTLTLALFMTRSDWLVTQTG
jgi:hypothetical protein